MKTGEKFRNLGKRVCASVMAFTMCMSLIPDVTVFAMQTGSAVEVTSLASTESTTDTSSVSEPNTESSAESGTDSSTDAKTETETEK